TAKLLAEGHPHTIRIKMPSDHSVAFEDMIRGRVAFETSLIDDKVLLKADGMPTYHLAVVVDDYLMKIPHALQGEEWLPSAPGHLLRWKYLVWEADMPNWAHLPLILKPDGNGKLSKGDGARLGFPVYAMNWTDPATAEITPGFREIGFMPEAFINMLAMLGWNDGTEQELFSLEELIEKFSLEHVSKAGAKFNYEKAKWFSAEWIKKTSADKLYPEVAKLFAQEGIEATEDKALSVIDLVKDRCTFIADFVQQAGYFFRTPAEYDLNSVQPKWSEQKEEFFHSFSALLSSGPDLSSAELEAEFKQLAQEKGLKVGDVMLPYRIMLVGGKFGPAVFDITKMIGEEEAISRIFKALVAFKG